MKTTLLALLLISAPLFAQESPLFGHETLGPLDLPLPSGAVAPATTPVPQVVVQPIIQQPPLASERFQEEALGWIKAIAAILGTATVVLVPVVAVLWSKLHDVITRQGRQAEKTGSLQEQVTAIARQTPPVKDDSNPPTNPPTS